MQAGGIFNARPLRAIPILERRVRDEDFDSEKLNFPGIACYQGETSPAP